MYKVLLISIFSLLLVSCQAFKPKKVDTRETPVNAAERAKKNIREGRGTSLESLIRGGSGTTYEFSTSNPMWRASLEILDFLPLATVDYSGGVIITDWYNDNTGNDSIKITLRFLSNEIRADSLKVIVHKKKCSANQNCRVDKIKSQIEEELLGSILKSAALIEKSDKKQ